MSDADAFDPAVLDALVQGLEPSKPSASLRDRLFGALNTTARFLPFLDRMMRIFDLPEEQAKSELGTIDAPSDWDALTDGVQVRDFEAGDACGDAHGGLVRIEPGQSVTVFPDTRTSGKRPSSCCRGGSKTTRATHIGPVTPS